MAVSVVIPAYQAQDTLAETLASLAAQTFTGFEAIVVDDGAHDATWRIATGFARRDHRFRVLSIEHAGAGAARNAGLARAERDLVLFLDADDRLHPAMLELTRAALAADPDAVAAYCGWSRFADDGREVGHDFFRTDGDLFRVLAGIQPFAIHTCLARREALVAVGGFDPALVTCEDWDLWQRVARGGRRFACVPEVLALYRMKTGSASQDPRRMLADGLTVLERGGRHDPRVPCPAARWAAGLPERALRPHRYRLLAWSAGLSLGQGLPLGNLCELAGALPCPELEPSVIAEALIQAVLLPRARPGAAWSELWDLLAPAITDLAAEIERRSGAPRLADGVRRRLEELACDRVAKPAQVGGTAALSLDPFAPVADLETGAGIERMRIDVRGGIGAAPVLDLPAFDGSIPAELANDAVAASLTWPLLRAYFRARVDPGLTLTRERGATTIRRGILTLAEGLPADPAQALAALHEREGWTLFLQELWGHPDWPLVRFYEVRPEDAPRVRASRGHPVEVAAELPDLAIDAPALAVEVRVGGVAIGEVELPAEDGRITASHLRCGITRAAGFELARAAVREGLLGRPLDSGGTLRDRLREAARRKDGLCGARAGTDDADVAVLARRARGDLDTSVSRRAVLPAGALAELRAGARSAGEPLADPSQECRRIVYSPERIDALAATALEPDPPPAAGARPGPDTGSLPILVHHRIARDGADADLPHRLGPAAFEERLAMLRALGYRGVTLREWRRAMADHAPVPGRGVLLCFDDATSDFAESAWPLLQRYGFGAMLFVVTAAADSGRYRDPLTRIEHPALGWDDLARLAREGVAIGSHTVSHPFLTRLAPEEVVRELAWSRARLQERLGRPVHALAYPFGDVSPLVEHLAGACGYVYGLTCRRARAGLWDPLLALPRIDAGGPATGIGELASHLGLAVPPLDVRRSAS